MAQPNEFVAGERRGQMMPTVMCTMYYNQTTGRRETCQLSAPTINDSSPNASMLTKCLCLKQLLFFKVPFIHIFLLQERYSNIYFLLIDIHNLYILYIRVLDISILWLSLHFHILFSFNIFMILSLVQNKFHLYIVWPQVLWFFFT